MNIKKLISGISGAVLLSSALIFPLSLNVAAAESAPVSVGLYVLAEQSDMAMAGLSGNGVSFEREDFMRAMNLSRIDSVTVTKAPPMTDGELRLGNTVVTSGLTIGGASLSELVYIPSGADIKNSSFRFSVNGSPVDMECNLYILDSFNQCPTLSSASKNYLNVSTHRNVTLYGALPCYDPEGDETVIEIVSYPESGSLVLTNKNTGEYAYTPAGGFSGKDEFTYVARDKYGNYSASATVTLTVSKPKTSVTYADMVEERGYNAALTMTEEGIMSGRQTDSGIYFDPHKTVSRQDFVVMAMKSLGMREMTNVDKTAFADDSGISDIAKDYVGAAYELGYIKGELDGAGALCFYPERAISRAEAACILANMINAPTPTVTPSFSDASEIPAWAAPSIYSLNYMGILTASGGSISPMEQLTREDTAEILTALINSTRSK